jgi:hypothetical protein
MRGHTAVATPARGAQTLAANVGATFAALFAVTLIGGSAQRENRSAASQFEAKGLGYR